MATASESLSEGNEEVFDFNCSKCEEDDGRFVEAVSYCPTCPDYLCQPCLQQHRRFCKDHQTLDNTQKEDWGSSKRRGLTGRACNMHEGESISMFCKDHDALCCPVCVSLDHRNCKGMCYIPKIAKGIAKSTEFQQLISKIDELLATVEKAIATKKAEEKVLIGSHQNVLSDIEVFRHRVNAALDKLEEQIKKKASEVYKPVADDLSDELIYCTKFGEHIQRLKNELHELNETKETNIFIQMKMCQKKISEGEEVVKKCLMAVKPRLTFIENGPLLQDIENAINLGEIEHESEITNKLYKVSNYDSIDVSLPDDTSVCYVDGLCQMPDGQIIVTDKHNKSIKVLDASYKVTRHCKVPGSPRAVCCISATEITVALKKQILQFVDITNEMILTKSIMLGHECFGLAYNDGKLYITDLEKSVHIYSTSGVKLRTLKTDASGSEMFAETRHIAVSANGSRLYVTDKTKGLVVLDREGKHLSTFKSPELNGARGVCLDTHGNAFIVCCLSHNIAQIDSTGENSLGIIVEKKHGLYYPGLVVFDKVYHSLLVTSGPIKGCNELKVCYLYM